MTLLKLEDKLCKELGVPEGTLVHIEPPYFPFWIYCRLRTIEEFESTSPQEDQRRKMEAIEGFIECYPSFSAAQAALEHFLTLPLVPKESHAYIQQIATVLAQKISKQNLSATTNDYSKGEYHG